MRRGKRRQRRLDLGSMRSSCASGEAAPGTGILPQLHGCLLPPRNPPSDSAVGPEGTWHPRHSCGYSQGCGISPLWCWVLGRCEQGDTTLAGQWLGRVGCQDHGWGDA